MSNKIELRCTVYLAGDRAFTISGDVEFYVGEDGLLTVFDYGLREATQMRGLVFAAKPDEWTSCEIVRLDVPREAKQVSELVLALRGL